MKKPEFSPPLIDMINHCNNKGYEIIAVFEKGLYRFLIFKYDVLKVIGKKRYGSCMEGQKTVYYQLFKTISHVNK